MKRATHILVLILFLSGIMAFKSAMDSHSSLFDEIKLVAIKSPKQVEIKLNSGHFQEMEEIIIERSAEANGFYRQIKILYKEDIEKAKEEQLIVFDNYPLSVQSSAYYRVRIKLTTGVSRVYPGVQEISYDNFNAMRNRVAPVKTASTPKSNAKETLEEVVEISEEPSAGTSQVRDEKIAQAFEASVKNTTFSIKRESEFERKISIQLPAIDKVESIYIMMNNLQDQSYYTIKEFDREQILNQNLKGKLEYTFKLGSSAKPGTTYSIKLRLTSEIYQFETASQQFN